jgi:hypothetical protein
MEEIVSNIIQNSVGGMVAGAVTTIGGYAGEAVNGIGNVIESAGSQVGQGNSDFVVLLRPRGSSQF